MVLYYLIPYGYMTRRFPISINCAYNAKKKKKSGAGWDGGYVKKK